MNPPTYCVSARATVVESFSQTSDRKENPMQKSLWPGWASWNINIYRKYLVDAPQRRVVFAEYATADAARANCYDNLRLRHRPIRL